MREAHDAPSENLARGALREYALGALLLAGLVALLVIKLRSGDGEVVVQPTFQHPPPAPRVPNSWRDQAARLPPPVELQLGEPAPLVTPETQPPPEEVEAPKPRLPPPDPAIEAAYFRKGPKWVLVSTEPPGASVRVGTVLQGETPLKVPAPDGGKPVEISLSLEGYAGWSQVVAPNVGGHYVVVQRLVKEKADRQK